MLRIETLTAILRTNENSKVGVILGSMEDYWYPAGIPGSYPDNPP